MDIRTGEVVKDRGVLSELPKRYNFGDLADKDDDPAVNTDPGSEAADNLAEEDDEDEDEDDVEETDAFPSSEVVVAPPITRLAPLRPTTGSSDADDLREFLKAEAIRRELDGGDDSSEDEFNILPSRSTPARRTMTPARKTPLTARAKSRPPKNPAPDTESEDEFALWDLDRNGVHRGYRARRTPSPEVPASIPSPPPPSSSPGLSSSISLPSSPLVSHTRLNSNRGPQTERLGSPTPKRQPLASTSRRTLEDSLNEIDLEFPPPQPRAPSIFGKRPSSAFIIDLSISDDETEDERLSPPAKLTTSSKLVTSRSGTVKRNGSILTSKRPIPFVLIETKRPTLVTPASKPTSASRPKPRLKGKKSPTRLKSSDKEHDFSSESSPTKHVASLKSTPKSDSEPKSARQPAAEPKSTRSTRSMESGASTATAKPKSKTPRKPPEVLVDIEGDGRSSPPLPPSPSPAPPIRPRIRGVMKRKRRISSGPSSGEEQGSSKTDPGQQTSPPDIRVQACATTTPEVIDVDLGDRGDDPETGAFSRLYFFCGD